MSISNACRHKILGVILLAFIVLGSCKKAPPVIPVGFSSKLNNVLWIPTIYGALTFPPTTSLVTNGDSINLVIYANDSPKMHALNIFIQMNGPNVKTGSYNAANFECDIEYVDQYILPLSYIQIDSGIVTITKVSSNNIQGTFNAFAYYRKSGSNTIDTILITDGEFNMPLN